MVRWWNMAKHVKIENWQKIGKNREKSKLEKKQVYAREELL